MNKMPEVNENSKYTKTITAYFNVFNTPDGEIVLNDLWEIVGRTGLDAKDPNPNSAIYRLAQQAVLETIENKILAYNKKQKI